MLRKILTWLSSLFWKTNLEEPDDEDIPYRTKAYVEPEKKKKMKYEGQYNSVLAGIAITFISTMALGLIFSSTYNGHQRDDKATDQCFKSYSVCFSSNLGQSNCSKAFLFCDPSMSQDNKMALICMDNYKTCIKEGVEEPKCARTLIYCTPTTTDDRFCDGNKPCDEE